MEKEFNCVVCSKPSHISEDICSDCADTVTVPAWKQLEAEIEAHWSNLPPL